MNYQAEPTHISNAILDILEEWKLKSNVLTLSDECIMNTKLCLIEDIFKIRKHLMKYDKSVKEPTGTDFDELYDLSNEDLEVRLCVEFALIKNEVLKNGGFK